MRLTVELSGAPRRHRAVDRSVRGRRHTECTAQAGRKFEGSLRSIEGIIDYERVASLKKSRGNEGKRPIEQNESEEPVQYRNHSKQQKHDAIGEKATCDSVERGHEGQEPLAGGQPGP